MNIEDYGPNSNKYKAEQEKEQKAATEKRVQKVVTGLVITKKNELRKVANIFAPGDMNKVGSYIVWDVVVPAIKDALEDVVTNGIRMILRGDTSPRDRFTNRDRFGYVDYSKRSNSSSRSYQTSNNRPRTVASYDDIILQNRGDAEYVLDQMRDVLDQYKIVRVADLYELIGQTAPFTANRYGWTNLSSATVERVREGYLLKLPRAMPID